MALFEKKQSISKIEPKKSPPPKPKTIFEEKKEWSRIELERRMRKASSFIPGAGKFYTRQERKEMLGRGLEKIFPYARFKSHISEMEAKRVLRELRRQEFRARTGAEKLKISRERRWLEEIWGLKGKY
jgi:hypothetical protein